MVVLHKVIRQSHRFELVLAKRFHEEAAAVLKNVGHQHRYISQRARFNFDIHGFLVVPFDLDLLPQDLRPARPAKNGTHPSAAASAYRSKTRSAGCAASPGSSPFSTNFTASSRRFQSNIVRRNSCCFFAASVAPNIILNPYSIRRSASDASTVCRARRAPTAP